MGNDKKDFLFRFLPTHVRNALQFDEEALYSTTDQLTAEKICKDLLKVVSSNATLTDATACIGGSCFSMSKVFKKVFAIEIDPQRFHFLCQNVNTLGVHDVVTCLHGDAMLICKELQQDLIFLDPPWGGPEYKNLSAVSLSLSGVPLAEVCKELSEYAMYIAIKVPKNFDELTFLSDTHGVLEIVLKNTNLRKMHLLVLRRKI